MKLTENDKKAIEEYGGYFRTVMGRKVFIKEGQSLTDAMKASGKFKKSELKETAPKSPKVVKVKLNTEVQKEFDAAKTPKEQRKIMCDYIMKNLRGRYTASDGRVVEINAQTADKYTHLAPVEKLKVAPELAKLIKAGVLEKATKADHKRFVAFAYYKVAFKIGKKVFTGLLNVGIRKNGSSALYDLNPYNEQKKKD